MAMMAAPATPVTLSRSPSRTAARTVPVRGSSRLSRAAVLPAIRHDVGKTVKRDVGKTVKRDEPKKKTRRRKG